MTDLKRQLEILPAWDKRQTNPEYGQHCMEMRWYLIGPKGVIQFVLYTGWYAGIIAKPDVNWQELFVSRGETRDPMPADLGYHSPVPMYEGQTAMDECHMLPSGKCYYDGSGLNANRIFSILVHEGGEAVWKALEEEYVERFEQKEVTQ